MTSNIPKILNLSSMKKAVVVVKGEHYNDMVRGISIVENFADLGDNTGKLVFVFGTDIPYIDKCIERLKKSGAYGIMASEPAADMRAACDKAQLTLIDIGADAAHLNIAQEVSQTIIDDFVKRENYIRECYNSFYKDEFSCDVDEIIENLAHILDTAVIAYYAGGRIGGKGCFDADDDAVVIEKEENGKQFIQIGETVMEGVIIPFRVLDRAYGQLFIKTDRGITYDEQYLVKGAMTAITMATTREFAVTEIEHKMRNELLNDLITGNIQSENSILIRAKELEWNITKPSLAVICKLDITAYKNKNDMISIHHKIKNLLSELMDEKYGAGENHVIGVVGDKINILWPMDTSQNYAANCDDIRSVLEVLFEKGRDKYSISSITGGIGSEIRSISDMKRSFEDGMSAIKYGYMTGTGSHIYDMRGLGIYRFIGMVGNRDELMKFIPETLKRLISHEGSYRNTLIETLEVYLACDGNLHKASQEMDIHYKTLTYRINKIKEIMELESIEGDVRLEIQVGIKILRMLELSKERQNIT